MSSWKLAGDIFRRLHECGGWPSPVSPHTFTSAPGQTKREDHGKEDAASVFAAF